MNNRMFWALILFIYCVPLALSQSAHTAAFDPMKELSKTFPDTVRIKNKGHLLEFCPDGTCDGFVTSGNFSVRTLKDFAYLYVYFFSDYTFLGEWRGKEEAKNTAEVILSKTEYQSCKNEDSREAARCVLRDLSKGGRVKLIFVRYDEGERHAVPKSLASKTAGSKPKASRAPATIRSNSSAASGA